MYYDPDGHMALWALALVGIGVCGLINGTANTMTKMLEESAWGAFVGGFFGGAVSAAALAASLAIATFTGVAGWVILGGTVAVTGGFIGGKSGNAISQQISYGNVD